jgi:two-component system, LytTR family, sensor kinase
MKRKTIILIHFLFWFYMANQSIFPFYVKTLEEPEIPGNSYMNYVLVTLFLHAVSFYAIYLAFPRISAIRNKLLIIITSVITVGVVTGLRLGLNLIISGYFGFMNNETLKFEWVLVWNELRLCIILGIYAVLIRFLIRAFEAQKLRNEIVNHRQAGELALIKAQVNPHFLFNTLNNIYSLVYKKSDEAPEAVMKFSSIMRYVLNEANNETVPLDREIEYIRSYIELQKFRYSQPGYVEMKITGATGMIRIEPMLLIPFVENAFKHGKKDHIPAIIIDLKAENHEICLKVTNYLKDCHQQLIKESGVMGLSNIRRRLELTYPGKHELSAKIENGQFKVYLLIKQ